MPKKHYENLPELLWFPNLYSHFVCPVFVTGSTGAEGWYRHRWAKGQEGKSSLYLYSISRTNPLYVVFVSLLQLNNSWKLHLPDPLVVCFASQLHSHKPKVKTIKRHVFVLALGPSSFFLRCIYNSFISPMNLMAMSNGYGLVILVRHRVAERRMTPSGDEAKIDLCF